MKASVKKITKLFGLLLLASFIVQGCSNVSDPYSDADVLAVGDVGQANIDLGGGEVNTTCMEETTTELTYSPWKKYGGDITYEVTTDEVIVTFIPKDGWGITETHLLITTDEGELSEIPGHFPYGDEFDSAEDGSIEYIIPLSDLGVNSEDLTELYIYAYAVTGPLTSGGYYAYGGGGGHKWGKKGKSSKNKWNKKSNKNKWGKKDKGGHWSKKSKYCKTYKKSDYCKKHRKKDYCDKDDHKKKYCDKKKTESVWAKIHIDSFDDCQGSGSTGGTD